MENIYKRTSRLTSAGITPQSMMDALKSVLIKNLEVRESAEPGFKLPKQSESKRVLAAEPSAKHIEKSTKELKTYDSVNPFAQQLKGLIESNVTNNVFKPNAELDFENKQSIKVPYKTILSNGVDKITDSIDKRRLYTDALVLEQTKDLDNLIDVLSKQIEQIKRQYLNDAMIAGDPLAASVQASVLTDKINNLRLKLNDTISQRNKVANAIKEELDPAANAFRFFKNFDAPTLVELGENEQRFRESFVNIEKLYNNGTATRDQVIQAANALRHASNKLEQEQIKLNKLDNFLRVNNLPDSVELLPKLIRLIVEQLIPGSTEKENFEYIKNYILEQSLRDVKGRARAAGLLARTQPVVNEQYLEDLENSIKALQLASEYITGADKAPSTTMPSPTAGFRYTRSELAGIADPNYRTYEKALAAVNQAKEYKKLHDAVKVSSGFFSKQNWINIGYGAAKSLEENLRDPFGVGAYMESKSRLALKEKIDRGEDLNAAENAYLLALGWDAVMRNNYGDFEKVGGYKAGYGTVESLRFMADFILLGAAINSIVKAGTKQAGKGIAKNVTAKVADFIGGGVGDRMMAEAAARITEQYGKEGVQAALRRAAVKIPGFTTKVAGDALNAAIMTGVTQLPKTLSDINELQTGIADYDVTDDGKLTTSGFTGGLDFAEAVRVGATRDWIENFSEMMGEWGAFSLIGRTTGVLGSALGKAGISALNKVGYKGTAVKLGNVVKGITDSTSKFGKWVRNHTASRQFADIMAKGLYHGIFGELSEEYYGIALNHLLGVSDSGKNFWDEVSSKETFMDLFGTLALSLAFLGTIGVGSYLRTKHKYNIAKQEAADHFGDEWDGLYNTIINTSQDRLPATIDALIQSRPKAEDKEMLLRFYGNLEQYRGSSYAELEDMNINVKNNQELLQKESKETGYTQGSIQLSKDLRRTISVIRPQVELILNIDTDQTTLEDYIDANGGYENVARSLDKESGDAVRIYANLEAMYEGAQQRLSDDIDIQLDQHLRAIDRITHNKLNEVIRVTLKNGKSGFITAGKLSHKLQIREDKSGVDRVLDKGSDDKLTINYSPYSSEEISVDDISSINEVVQADRFKSISTARLAKELYDLQDEQLQELGTTVGDTYSGIKIGGQYTLNEDQELEVLGVARDGGMLYSIKDKNNPDGEYTVHHAETLQEISDIIAQNDQKRSEQLIRTVAKRVATTSDDDIADEDVSAGNIDAEIQQRTEQRIAESQKDTTEFIPVREIGRLSKSLKDVFNKIKLAAQELKKSATFDDFKNALRRKGISIDDIYDGRLHRIYDALRSGKLSAKNFAAIFIPENKRSSVLSKAEFDRFNQLYIDIDGVVGKRQQTPEVEQPVEQPIEQPVEQPAVVKELPEVSAQTTEPEQPVRTVDISVSPEYLIKDEDNGVAPQQPVVVQPDDEEKPSAEQIKIAQSVLDIIESRIQLQLLNFVLFLKDNESLLTDSDKYKLSIVQQNVDKFLQLYKSLHTSDNIGLLEATSLLGESALVQMSTLMENIQTSIDDAIITQLEQERAAANLRNKPEVIYSTDDPVNSYRNITTTHKANYGESVGLEGAVAEDDPTLRLGDVTSRPDFVQLAKFIFIVKPVTIKGKTQRKVHVQVIYDGHTYQPVAVLTAYNKAGNDFYENIVNAFDSLQDGSVIVPGVKPSRTNGAINRGTMASMIDKRIVSTSKNSPGIYLYDIEYSQNDNRFGMVMSDKKSSNMYVVRPGQSNSGRDLIYPYPYKDNRKPQRGTFVYLHRMPFLEITSQVPIVPINMYNVKLTEGDVDLILGILEGKYSTNATNGHFNMLKSEFVENGVNKGFTNEDVLNMLISYGMHNYKGRPHVHIEFDKAVEGRVHIIGNVVGDPEDQVQDRVFDLPLHRDELRLFLLNNVTKNIDENFLEYRLAEWFDLLPKQQQLVINYNISRHGVLKFGGSSIIFDKSDFREPGNEALSKGLSGMAWYIKRGYFESDFDGISDALLKFDESGGIRIENKEYVLSSTIDTPAKQPSDDVSGYLDQDIDYYDDGLGMSDDKRVRFKVTPVEKRVKRNEVIKNLRRILGSKFVNDKNNIRIINGVVEAFDDDIVAIGRCYRDSIILSNYAEKGTEYHEAFHRVSNWLFTEQERKRAYDDYRSVKKLTIAGRKYLTDEEVEERMADEFMYYQMNRPTFKLRSIIKDIFTCIPKWIMLWNKVGSFRMIRLYRSISRGKYADRKVASGNKKKYGDKNTHFDYSKRGIPLESIADEHSYKLLINSLCALLLDEQTQTVLWDGSNIKDLKTDKETVINSPIFKTWIEGNPEVKKKNGWGKVLPESTRRMLLEAVDNWDVIQPDVVSFISQFSTDAKVRFDEAVDSAREGIDNEASEDTYEEEIASASNEEHIKASYEFSPFSRTSSKVKWFFAGMREQTYGVSGKRVAVPNELGLPILLDSKAVFASVLNECHDVRSIQELLDRLERLGKSMATFMLIHNRLLLLYNKAYPADGKVDYNAELTLIQIFNTVRANKNNFKIVKTFKDKNNDTYWWKVVNSDDSYTSTNYTRDWSTQFASGACKFIRLDQNGRYVMREGYNPLIFEAIYNRFYGPTGMEVAYSTYGKEHLNDPNAPHYTYGSGNKEIIIDVSKPGHVELTKQSIITLLRNMGIIFDKNMFDFMLYHKYGNTGEAAMTAFIQDRSKSSFKSFVDFIRTLGAGGVLQIDANGNYFGKPVNTIFNNKGFVSEIANYKYQYRTSHDVLNVLATNNKQFYVISENNLFSDRLSEILNDPIEREKLINTPYVSYVEESAVESLGTQGNVRIGSLIAKHVDKQNATPLQLILPIGLKSDKYGDTGIDYLSVSKREDYVQKAALLLSGALIAPVLSDKKAYFGILGLHVPGLDYSSPGAMAKSKAGNSVGRDGKGNTILSFPTEVLDQLIEYALCEDRSIANAIAIQNSIPNDQKIKNLHKGAKVEDALGNKHVTYQAGRYTSFLGCYTLDGDYVEFNKVKDENGMYVSESDCYDIAHRTFFDPQNVTDPQTGKIRLETADELKVRQRLQIAATLTRQVEAELEYLKDIGLIKQRPGEYGLFSYENVGMDQTALTTIINSYGNTDPSKVEQILARALTRLVSDITTRHIISIEEFQRIFSGTPQAFKAVYDDNGHLIDTTTDMFKRMGGLGSTGTNNYQFPGMPDTYKCAEVDNEMLESEHLEEYRKLIYEGTLRSTYLGQVLLQRGIDFDNIGDKQLADFNADVDNMEIEEIEKLMPKTALEVVKEIAKAKTDAFRKDSKEHLDGIDVADGGAYITDKMAETLLRSVGLYNEDIRKAFAILRGEEVDGKVYTSKDVRAITEAYQKVLTTVIGTQKYTAYGFRYLNGLAAPYYNKMALFPLFKTVCTGKMAKVYQNMLDDNIDMLMINSAVKVGSQGSKPINWDEWSSEDGDGKPDFNDKDHGFHFNTYDQKFSYLRKQFNTDPKEKELMSMGTLAKKIALSTLQPGRLYNVNGKMVDGTALRDDIMESLRDLSDIGTEQIHEMFFTDGMFNVNKFSKIITKELQDRGASAEMLDAVSVVKRSVTVSDGKGGTKAVIVEDLKVPLDALGNMSWLQSIIKSLIDKRVVDTNTPGKAFYQRSVWGMEGPTNVLGDDNMPPSLNHGEKLLTKNEEGSMDCVLSLDFFEDILKKVKVKTGNKVKRTRKVKKTRYVTTLQYGGTVTDYTKTEEYEAEEEYEVDEKVSLNTRSFDEQKQWLIDHGIISGVKTDETEWSNATANIMGYRIPTQAISSVHALRCVDVIPVVRDTVILPAEFTKITGSDFDIDKVFMSMLYYDENGNTNFNPGTQEYHANRLLTSYLAILKDSGRSFADLNGSIDNDTELIKSIVRDLEEDMSKDVVLPYLAQTLRINSQAKDEFAVGKKGIGPFALNNNIHILAMLYGLRFKNNGILGLIGCTNMGARFDRDNKSILSWFSGLINAHVDVAKDPYISRLNVNQYTYNLVSLLIHTGFGKDTFHFTSNPIMKLLATAYNNASGSYMTDQNGKRDDMLKKALHDVIINMYNRYYGANVDSYQSAIDNWETNKAVKVDDIIEAIFAKGNTIMHDIAKLLLKNVDEIIADDHVWHVLLRNGTEIDLSTFDVQMVLASANFKLQEPAEALSKLVLYTKIDTKKEGKSIIEQRAYKYNYNQLFSGNGAARLVFDTQSLDRLNSESYINTMTRNAILSLRSVLGDQSISATETFYKHITKIASATDMEFSLYTIKDIQKSLLARIKSEFFFGTEGYANKNNINPRDLFYGSNSIYNQLLGIKALILNDPQYSDLADKATGEPRNYFLRNIVSGGKYNTPNGEASFIQPLSLSTDDTINEDEMIQGWSDLLNDSSHPDVQKFAKQLIVYAFMVSGDNGGAFDLFRFIPTDWKLGFTPGDSMSNSYVNFIRKKLQEYKNGEVFLTQEDFDDIILNNWDDNRFIPDYTKTEFIRWTMGNTVPVILAAHNTKMSTISSFNAPRFIKIKAPGGNANVSKSRYYVYKFVGTGRHILGKEQYSYPIYAMINAKGEVFSKRDTIHEYGMATMDTVTPTLSSTMNTLNQLLASVNRPTIDYTNSESILEDMSRWARSRNGILSIVGLSDPRLNYLSPQGSSIIRDYMLQEDYIDSLYAPLLPKTPVAYYEGNILPEPNRVFVFGSNTQGRHGAGAALMAALLFGAVYGQPEGLQGNSYAIVTKDLTKPKDQQERSISKELIVEGIKRMYLTAQNNPELYFDVAYRNMPNQTTLNGYTGAEMIQMFKDAGPIPVNVRFSQEWANSGLFDDAIIEAAIPPSVTTQSAAAEGTYAVPPSTQDQVVQQVGQDAVDTTIKTLESDNSELSQREKKSITLILGDKRPRVLIASEHTDPVFHAQLIKQMVEEELKKDPKDRSFHMMYLITKHDGLPLKELAELKIPKFVHFSITSLGGTKYEPGVMKMDDLLDRIEQLIKDGVLNPNLITIRIDPIIPGVTKQEDVRHIFERATSMGIRQFKFSVMDSYGYTESGERSENDRDRFIIQKMTELGYDWDTYYGRRYDGKVNFDAKSLYIEEIFKYVDELADEFNVAINTCGEKPVNIPTLKRIKTQMGCVSVLAMNAAMGTTDIAHVQGNQRQHCSCYGLKSDALRYSDKCASSCVYCYAKHNTDAAIRYYNEDGTLKDDRFTRTSDKLTDITKVYEDYMNQYVDSMPDDDVDEVLRTSTNVKSKQKTTSNKIIDWIIKNSKNESYVRFAKLIKPYVDTHPVEVIFNPTHRNESESGHCVASYGQNGVSDIFVEMFPTTDLYKLHPQQSILHEIVHSITSVNIDILTNNSKRDFINEYIRYILDYIEEHIDSKYTQDLLPDEHLGIYGLISPSEFVAEFMSNPYFLNLLKSIPAMEEKKFENLFEEVIDWISKVIRSIITGRSKNAFEQIKPIIEGIVEILSELDYNAPLAEQYHKLLDSQLTDIRSRSSFNGILPNEYGDHFGWSVESIYNHLVKYVEQSTGISKSVRKNHVKAINARYGTNFGVYEKNGYLKIKYNTNDVSMLKLTLNPNDTLMYLFREGSTQEWKEQLKSAGAELMEKCNKG